MKIYCKTDRQNNLDRFVGKDLWILCELRRPKSDDWGLLDFWIKIIDADEENYYVVPMIAMGSEPGSLERYEYEKEIYLNKSPKIKCKTEIRPILPMMALTTDELFSMPDPDLGDLGE